MKKLLIEGLLVGFFLLIGVGYAQNFNLNSKSFPRSHSNYLQNPLDKLSPQAYDLMSNVKRPLQKSKDIIPFLVDTAIVSGTENNYRYSFAYDSKGKVKSQLKEILKNNKYENLERDSYLFDYENNSESFEEQRWENGEWKIVAMYTRSYNSEGNEIQSIFYSNFLDGTWKPMDRVTITYHFDRVFSCILWETNINGCWTNSFKTIQKLDEKFRTTDLVDEFWESNKWNLVDNSWHYDYSNLSDTTVAIRKIWKSNNWINDQLEKYIANSKNEYESLITYKWNENSWSLANKWYLSKNENGAIEVFSYEFWSNNKCDSINRTTYLYDYKKNIQSELEEIFKNGNWLNKTKENYNYDESGNVVKFEVRNWVNSTWQPGYSGYGLQYLHNSFWGSDVTLHYKSYDQLVGVKESKLPFGFELHQNYPNPFNPETTISYKVQAASQVSLKVFDVLGREVATLVNEFQQPGSYVKTLHATSLPSGIYFYRLQAGSFISTKKMILLQ